MVDQASVFFNVYYIPRGYLIENKSTHRFSQRCVNQQAAKDRGFNKII